MASLSIPEPIAVGLTSIATLSDESFGELLSALEGMPLKLRQHRIFDDSSLELKTISPDEAKSIKEALFPIISGQSAATTPVSEYVNSIADSLKGEGKENIKWTHSDDTFNLLKQRLAQLLSIQSLQLIAKAHDILLEHAQTFSRARIVSDVRPVFGEKIEDSPSAAVIVHMLNITYHDASGWREFVVALDTKDIQLLMDTLERAKAKTESLKSVISSTNMTYIEVV